MSEYYRGLPDYLPVDEIKNHFLNLLVALENQETDLEDFCKSMAQVADRQWHTYELLETELRSRIDTIMANMLMQKVVDQLSIYAFRGILFTIGSLGLRESYDVLGTSLIQSVDNKKKKEIEEFVRETKVLHNGDIEDPYYTLR